MGTRNRPSKSHINLIRGQKISMDAGMKDICMDDAMYMAMFFGEVSKLLNLLSDSDRATP
eukprot:9106477-Karenia_brevis.AAC.1